MSLKTPRYLDEHDSADERSFTNREDAFSLLDEALRENVANRYRVLNFYGVGGVGKTRLCKQLGIHLNRRGSRTEGPLWAMVDFQEKDHRDSPSDVLFHMRRELRTRYRLDFPTFDIAYAIRWQQLYPQTELTRGELPFLEEGELLTEIVDAVQEVPGLGLLTQIPRFLHRTSQRVQEWWVRRGQRSLARLRELKGFEIERLLPSYWALDLQAQAGDRPAVLLLDTYELLRQSHQAEGGASAVDEWVRNWILELPGVVWIIAGREKLAWQEIDPDWAEAIRHFHVDDLAEHHVQAFLRTCGIVEPEVVDAMFRATQGNPFYLNLAVDRHNYVAGSRSPRSEDFGTTPFELAERFTRGLGDAQLGTLEILAVPNGWDRELFTLLVKHFDTGFATQQYPKLVRFSFIRQESAGERWNMHALMRRTLLEHPRFAETARVHAFLFAHFKGRLEGVAAAAAGPAHLEALREAVFHGHHAVSVAELREWFLKAVDTVEYRAHAHVIIPLFQAILEHSRNMGDGETPADADLYRGLGQALSHRDRYAETESAFRAALRIRQATLQEADPAIAGAHFNLGWMLISIDRLDESRIHAREAERIYAIDHAAQAARAKAAVDDFPHEGYSDALRLLGLVHGREYQYAQAIQLYERALALSPPDRAADQAYLRLELVSALNLLDREPERANVLRREAIAILEERYGEGSIRAIEARASLVYALQAERRFDEAEALCMECLEIYRKVFGEESSQVAGMLTSLAIVRMDAGAESTETAALFESAFSSSRAAYGDQHSATAFLSMKVASTYEQPELVREKALPLLIRAHETLRTLYGDTHPQTVYALADLALAYNKIGDLAEADRLMAQTATHAADPVQYDAITEAFVLQKWSDVQQRLLRNGDAEASLRRAAEIYAARLPKYRPGLANTLRDLGILRSNAGQGLEAGTLFTHALALEEELYGPDDLRVVNTLLHVAFAQRQTGELGKSLATVARVLRIQRAHGREQSVRAWEARLLKGLLLGDLGLRDEAIAALRRAIAEADAEFPHLAKHRLHPRVALAALLAETGTVAEAEGILTKFIADAVAGSAATPALVQAAASAYEKLLDTGTRTHPELDALLVRGTQLADELEILSADAAGYVRLYRGEALFRAGRYTEAISALEAARERARESPDPVLRHRIMAMLGWSLGNQGETAKALPLLLESIEAAQAAFGPGSISEAKICELVTELYLALPDARKALHFATRCLEMRTATRGGEGEAAYARALVLEAWTRGLAGPTSMNAIEAQLQAACEIYVHCPGDLVRPHAQALLRLGEVRSIQKSDFAAEATYREVLARVGTRTDVTDHRLLALANLANLILSQTTNPRLDEAEALLREAERVIRDAALDVTVEAVRTTVDGLVQLAFGRGRFDELDACATPALAEVEGTAFAGGPWHQEMLVAAVFARMQQGRVEAAEVALVRLLDIPAFEPLTTAAAVFGVAALVLKPLLAAGETARARELFGRMESAAARTRVLAWQSKDTLLTLHARLIAAEGDLDRAESLLDTYMNDFRQTGRATEEGIESMEAVAAWRAGRGEHVAEAHWYRRALEMRERLNPRQLHENALAAMNLGVALVQVAEWDQAAEVLGKALEGHERNRSARTVTEAERSALDARVAEIIFNLGRVEYELGARESALTRFERSFALSSELFGMQDARTSKAREWLDRVRKARESGTSPPS